MERYRWYGEARLDRFKANYGVGPNHARQNEVIDLLRDVRDLHAQPLATGIKKHPGFIFGHAPHIAMASPLSGVPGSWIDRKAPDLREVGVHQLNFRIFTRRRPTFTGSGRFLL